MTATSRQPKTLVLDLALGSTSRAGLWCPTCALPSGYEADVLALTPAGVTAVGTYRGCTNADDPARHRPSA